MTTFDIFRYDSDSVARVWTGSTGDDSAPLAFIADMSEFGPHMALGDTLTLNKWHYAVRIA